jgi:SAM-dependent methyltransferase
MSHPLVRQSQVEGCKIPEGGRRARTAPSGVHPIGSKIDRVFQPIEDLLADAVSPGTTKRVLDVGCGTGGTTVAVARRLGAGSATGIDISEAMIAAARGRAKPEGSSVTFIVGDAQTDPLEPGGFDAIVSRFGVMFFDDPIEAFANLRRAASAGACSASSRGAARRRIRS